MTTFAGPSIESVPGLAAMTLDGLLTEACDHFAEREAMVFDDPLLGGTQRWTYTRLLAEARLIAAGLVGRGIGRGQTVGVLMGNRPEAVASIFGIAMTGAIAAPMSTFAPVPELEHMVRLCGARLVLTQKRLLDRCFGEDLASIGVSAVVLGDASWTALHDGGGFADEAFATQPNTADDPALVIFSSGTTSEPKGILHAHRSPTVQSRVQAHLFGRTADSRVFSALPLFWTAGFNTALCATLAAGGCWISQEVFEPRTALALMQRERVTEPYTMPHQTAAIAELAEWADADLSSLTCVFGKGAYARHPSVSGDPNWFMPVGWGMSEMSAIVSSHLSSTPRSTAKVGHGRLVAGALIRVIDSTTGEELDADQEGELCVSGLPLMLGYLGKERAECFDADGFFHTGDVGHVSADGIVHWSGRRTEMIKTGGANVSPAEVEVALRACPPVKLSRVLGIPDRRLDEIVVACIVLRDGTESSAEEIRAFLKTRIAAYKVPKRVLLFDELPMTASGAKVRDDALRDLVAGRLAADANERT